jgi:PiT family inorganic phosphate transporter
MIDYFYILGGIYFGWSLGANDSANVFGTAVATRILKFWVAILFLSVFVFVGSILEGPKCMQTMSNVATISLKMTAIVTVSSAITMTALTIWGIPASSSQAIMGAIIGATILRGSPNWSAFLNVVLCWIGTPIGAAIIAFLLYRFLDAILSRTLGMSGAKFNTFIRFGIIITGCMGAYSLGANNVANVTGVYVAAKLISPFTASVIGAIGIIFGAATYSRKVMETVGHKITLIGPLAALVAVAAESITVYIYTQVGVPVSTSQAIVGAVVGIGLIRGIKAVNKRMIGEIIAGWLTTPLASGMLAFIGSLFIR